MTNSIKENRGLVIAAPASGSGKTVVTLGLIHHLAELGLDVTSAKVGPDYIDPAFHVAAGGRKCFNLDPWAMRSGTMAATAKALNSDMIICEGVMGLFDGANIQSSDDGSTANLSRLTGWPVLLVIDAHSQAASAAALLKGFVEYHPDVLIVGVIFNRVGSDRHKKILYQACKNAMPTIPIIGCLPRSEGLILPERHLGLVQALEHPDLEIFIKNAAKLVASHFKVDHLIRLAQPLQLKSSTQNLQPLPPLGGRIAVASDEAFSFSYASVIKGWRNLGAEIIFFSPLADEAPDNDADAVYLPGGYPELFAGKLAVASNFMKGLRELAKNGIIVFGECGGYMVLGNGLIDASGARYAMAGLLGLETSFFKRELHLGYRRIKLLSNSPLGDAGSSFRGHEFHYSSIISECGSSSLFEARDAEENNLGPVGLVEGKIMGSFLHLIDQE